jgi:hypothetical protein
MNRLPIFVALALAFSPPAFAQNADQTSDPAADTHGVDTSSTVDRQAMETYSRNAEPPVPAARLAPDRPADMRPKDITGSADPQASEVYNSNALSPVPVARYGRTGTAFRYSHRTKHRPMRHGHVAGDPAVIYHSADHAIVEPTSTSITIPPGNN